VYSSIDLRSIIGGTPMPPWGMRESQMRGGPMKIDMPGLDLYGWLLVCGTGAAMSLILLRGIAMEAVTEATGVVSQRRKEESQRRADNAAAEAAGKAAMLEPLALNPDGTVEEPIIGQVEGR
jgi:hypothetical protein